MSELESKLREQAAKHRFDVAYAGAFDRLALIDRGYHEETGGGLSLAVVVQIDGLEVEIVDDSLDLHHGLPPRLQGGCSIESLLAELVAQRVDAVASFDC